MAKLTKMRNVFIVLVVLAVLALYCTQNVREGFVSFDDFLKSIGVLGFTFIIGAIVIGVLYFILSRQAGASKNNAPKVNASNNE